MKWFLIFNAVEFDATGLVSKLYKLELEGFGVKEILVTKGVNYGITFNSVFLSLELNGVRQFTFETYSIYKKSNGDVYLGVPQDED